jgi:hypothetical protein
MHSKAHFCVLISSSRKKYVFADAHSPTQTVCRFTALIQGLKCWNRRVDTSRIQLVERAIGSESYNSSVEFEKEKYGQIIRRHHCG